MRCDKNFVLCNVNFAKQINTMPRKLFEKRHITLYKTKSAQCKDTQYANLVSFTQMIVNINGTLLIRKEIKG